MYLFHVYVLHPTPLYGPHPADLEHVKVWVCEDDMLNDDPSTAVRRAQYSQHGWLPDFDCTAGECNWETDDAGVRRIVTYAGLGSHSNWPWETPLYVYTKVGWGACKQGVCMYDRVRILLSSFRKKSIAVKSRGKRCILLAKLQSLSRGHWSVGNLLSSKGATQAVVRVSAVKKLMQQTCAVRTRYPGDTTVLPYCAALPYRSAWAWCSTWTGCTSATGTRRAPCGTPSRYERRV